MGSSNPLPSASEVSLVGVTITAVGVGSLVKAIAVCVDKNGGGSAAGMVITGIFPKSEVGVALKTGGSDATRTQAGNANKKTTHSSKRQVCLFLMEHSSFICKNAKLSPDKPYQIISFF